jgi:hypothetical protein
MSLLPAFYEVSGKEILTMRLLDAAPPGRPQGSTGDRLDEIGWSDFHQALHGLVHASCCGAGLNGALAARPTTSRPSFATMGHTAWRRSVKAAAPLLPTVSGPIVLPEVTIVEPDRAARPRVDVFIDAGRIEHIVPTGARSAGTATVVEQVRGHFVCPALADMHVHNPPSNVFNLTPLFLLLYLRHGVVRLREAGDVDGTGTPAALTLIESGALPGIDLHYCYWFVQAGAARWSNFIPFDHPSEAEAIVERVAHCGARWIKSYENLDAERVQSLVAAARRAGLGVMGHVPTKLSFEEALLPDTQHYFGIPSPHDLRGDHIVNRIVDWQGVTPARISETVDLCLRNGLAMTPTLSSGSNLLRLEHYERERRADDARLLPDFYADIVWHPVHGLPVFRGLRAEDFRQGREAAKRKLDLTQALWRAGVALRLGTDVQQPFAVPGASLHREMSAFEEAGVPRAQVWKLASLEAATALGVEDSGSIEEGKRADILASATSPLEREWSARALSAVSAGGHLMLVKNLDAAIEAELARFKGAIGRLTSRWLAQFALARLARRYVP